MKIGWHTWEPGLWSNDPNSAGGSGWVQSLWTFLSELDHEIIWLGQHPNEVAAPAKGEGLIEECDVIYLYWRWRMHESYEERNKAYDNQMELIKLAGKQGIPLVIGDGDHKMTPDDIVYIHSNAKAILVAPELAPRKGFTRLHYPNPHYLRDPLESRIPFMGFWDLIYIGNNYERMDQFVEYIAKPASLGLRTQVFGNWLEPHPDRASPEEVRKLAPKVVFSGRLRQAAVIDNYLVADATVHLAKPSYCKTGFITMRWAEAAAAAIFGYIPLEFKHLPPDLAPMAVLNGQHLYDDFNRMTEEIWFTRIMLQQKWVAENMTQQAWLDIFEEATKI